MNNRAMTLALAIALFAVYLVYSWVSDVEERAQKKFGNLVLVVKAKRDIKETETLNETMLTLEAIPDKLREPSSISVTKGKSDQETNQNLAMLAGAVALVPIKEGEQITYNKISEPGIRTGLAPQIAPGRRALAMKVDDSTSVSRLVKPGDRVDIIAVLDLGGGKQNKVAKTILQDVVVLSVGKNVTNNIPRVREVEGNAVRYRSLAEDANYNTVTLELDPQQAQTLTLVANNGENALTISLRNNDDTERAPLGTTVLQDVLGGDGARAQRGPAGR